jgi:hypothetical protein
MRAVPARAPCQAPRRDHCCLRGQCPVGKWHIESHVGGESPHRHPQSHLLTKAFLKSRDQRKRVEMRFAHLKTIMDSNACGCIPSPRARPKFDASHKGFSHVMSRATSSATAARSQSHNRLDSRILVIFNKTIPLSRLPFKTAFGIANEKNLLDPPLADCGDSRWAQVRACRNYLLPGTV